MKWIHLHVKCSDLLAVIAAVDTDWTDTKSGRIPMPTGNHSIPFGIESFQVWVLHFFFFLFRNSLHEADDNGENASSLDWLAGHQGM